MKSTNQFHLCIVLFLLVKFTPAFPQNCMWAKSMGGPGTDVGQSICIDAQGNTYTTGYFQDTVDFDPGLGTYILVPDSGSTTFITKLSSTGNHIWSKAFQGESLGTIASINVDGQGNIYLGGHFDMTADFNPGIGVFNQTAIGGIDVFIIKLDSMGNFLWVKTFGGPVLDWCTEVKLINNHLYITGLYSGTSDFDPDTSIYNLSSIGIYDTYLVKLDTSGNFIWARSFGGKDAENGNSISLDALENIYVCGNFIDTVDFDPGIGVFELVPYGGADAFVYKLDSSGNFIWAVNFGGLDYESSFSIRTDLTGNIYLTGYFRGLADFDPGSGIYNMSPIGWDDIFISKLDSSGKFIWAKSIGGTSLEMSTGLCLGMNGDLYLTGDFYGTTDFDPGVSTYNLNSIDSSDIFICKLDTSGNFKWAKSVGGIGNDNIISAVLDNGGDLSICGKFTLSANFDSTSSILLTSMGATDIFIAKFNQLNVGIEESSNKTNLLCYPNPTSGAVTIELKNPSPFVECEVSNSIGQIIQSHKFYNTDKLNLEIQGESDVYIVRVKDAGNVSEVKLLKCNLK